MRRQFRGPGPVNETRLGSLLGGSYAQVEGMPMRKSEDRTNRVRVGVEPQSTTATASVNRVETRTRMGRRGVTGSTPG
jgi:hypothetical protein